MLTKEQISKIVESHGKWIRGEKGGERANLSGADLCRADLREANLCRANLCRANLSGADLREANLCRANLSGANLSGADLYEANLCRANLSGADLYGANLSEANLYGANLSGANLYGADLYGANLSEANLYGANGLPDTTKQFEFISSLERTNDGYICYKTFGETHSTPGKWQIKEGSILDEFSDTNMFSGCSYGINVGTIDWVKCNTHGQIWKCLIRFEWLAGVTIPFNTEGKFRAARVQLIEMVER